MSQHHDPVHPDSDHLTPEVLADLELGLLDEQSREHAELHLAQCPTCAALRGDLIALTAAMSDLPDEPMPDAVWQQLAAALDAEPIVTPAGAATIVPIDAARRRRWGRPGIGLVAGAAGVALVGAIFIPQVMDGLSSDGLMTAADSSGTGAAENESRDSSLDAYAATQSGTKYQEEALGTQVTRLVAARATFSPTPVPTNSADLQTPSQLSAGESTPSDGASSALTDDNAVTGRVSNPAAAQACLEGYLDASGVEPLAIDIGKWQGQPAAIIVLPNSEPSLVDVWVIDPDCSIPPEPLIFFATVAR